MPEMIRTRARPSIAPAQAEPVASPALQAHQGVKAEEGSIYIHRAHYQGRRILDEQESQEKIQVPIFGRVTPAKVEVEGSVTRNLGDFNSCRVAVRVKLPCYPEISEIDRVYLLTSNLVDRYVERELNIATGQANPEDPLPEV